MARRNSRFRGVPPPQRQIANDGFVGTGIITFGAVSTGTAVGSNGFQIVVPAITLVRSRGSINVSLLSSGAADNSMNGALGMKISSLEAFGVGLTALDTPLSDVEGDWVVYEPFSVFASATTVGEDATPSYWSHTWDSKGMRKLKANDVLYVTVEATQQNATNGSVLRFGYTVRQQFKL